MSESITSTLDRVRFAAQNRISEGIDRDQPHDAPEQITYYAAMKALVAVEQCEQVEQRTAERSWGWRYDWSSVGDLVTAEVALTFWAEVVAASSESTEPEDLQITVAGLTGEVKQRVRAMLGNSYRAGSTSMISNYVDQVKAGFAARIASEYGSLVGLPSNLTY